MHQRDSRYRLSLHQFLAISRRYREQQFEIFTVSECMIQPRAPILELASGRTDGNGFRRQHGTATALIADMFQVRSQAVADVDHGMEIGKLMERHRSADCR